MDLDLRIAGGNDLAAVQRHLKDAGESGKGLRKELYKAIFRATRGVKEDVRQNWTLRMPHRGGLSRRPLKVITKTRAGRDAGVRIITTSRDGYRLDSIDKGRVRHPVFGNRKVWATTNVQPGIITDPQVKAAPDVRVEIVRAIESIARRIESA